MQPPPFSKPNILLVDNEPILLEFCGKTLRDYGFRVLEAKSGPEALQLATESHVDLLITDISMPGMDGHTLASKLVEAYPRLPVLFITGERGQLLELCLSWRLTPSRLLGKPFSAPELYATALEVLSEAEQSHKTARA